MWITPPRGTLQTDPIIMIRPTTKEHLVPNPDENIADVWAQTIAVLEASPDMTPRQIAFIKLAKPLAILDDTVFIAVPHEQTRTYLETRVRDELVSAMAGDRKSVV